MTDPDSNVLEAAIARLDREGEARDQKLRSRLGELEHHAEWLETKIAQLFLLGTGTAAYFIVEEYAGQGIVSLVIAFFIGLIVSALIMESWKTPIPWRYLRKRSE
jgi:hypothetical protein